MNDIDISEEISSHFLEKDKFGIPILPSDLVSLNSSGNLDATIHVFTDITSGNEQHIVINFNDVETNRELPAFTYIKPDPQGKDPRKISNLKFTDESDAGKIRTNYILVGLLPPANCGFEKLWGMRNYLHQPATKDNLGIVCAVKDSKDSWSIRNYFEEKSVKGVTRKDLVKYLSKPLSV